MWNNQKQENVFLMPNLQTYYFKLDFQNVFCMFLKIKNPLS